MPETESLKREKGEIGGEEEHVLAVAAGPAVRVTHLEKGTRGGPGLLDRGFDEFVNELGDD